MKSTYFCHFGRNSGGTNKSFVFLSFISAQTKRDEPSAIVDYEKIDADARVSFQLVLCVSFDVWRYIK